MPTSGRPRHRTDVEVGDERPARFEDAAQLSRVGVAGKRLAEGAQRVDELLARGIADNHVVAGQLGQRLARLPMKCSQIAGSQIRRCGKRLQRRAAARKLPVHRLRQGARRRERALFDVGVLALVRKAIRSAAASAAGSNKASTSRVSCS